MLKFYSACRWLQLYLGFIFVQYILSDCVFPPGILINGKFVLQSSEDFNATSVGNHYLLRFHCFPGYTRIGPEAIVCIEEEWSDAVPTCIKMQCSAPPEIENGKYEIHSGVNRLITLGSIAVYSCNVGYKLESSTISNSTCKLRKEFNTANWTYPVPNCIRIKSCPDPGTSPDGKREGTCCFEEDVLRYSCNESFRLVGEEEIQCLSNGTWSSRRPLCRPLTDSCDLPPTIMHGIVPIKEGSDYYRIWEEVEVLCEPGYSYDGETKFIMCEESGQWEYEFINCTETVCNLPEPLENGRILELESTNRTEFPYNFELTYVCDKGYRLEGGESRRFCKTSGWSSASPYCTAVRCPDPGSPEDGYKEGDIYEVGARVRFKCSTGYFLMGSIERHCMPNGQWTGELARCDSDLNYCPNPGIPINGFKNNSNYDLGQIVGFGCQPGYIQVGSHARECLPDQTWSGKETICLGPYDFDNCTQMKDKLRITINKMAEKQQEEINKYFTAQEELWNGLYSRGRLIDLNYPSRMIFYFIFDVSGSIGKFNFDKSINFAKAIVKIIGISRIGARAGAITFSSEAEIQFLPIDFATTDEVLNALDLIEYIGAGSSTISALSLLRKECIPLTQAVLGIRNVKHVAFLFTDGRVNMGGDPQLEADKLKKAGVDIYSIGITRTVEMDTLYKIASDSAEEHHVFLLESCTTFSSLIQDVDNRTVDYSECGLGFEPAGSFRIVGGSRNTEPWPWLAAIYFLPNGTVDSKAAEYRCGGSIINRFFILTAADCLYATTDFLSKDSKDIIVKLGLIHVKNKTFLQELEVSGVFVHPNYQPGTFYFYNIAILQLSQPIEYNAHIRPICLPPSFSELPEDSNFYKPAEYALATGWGHQELGFKDMEVDMNLSKKLQEFILSIQAGEVCNQSLVNNGINANHSTDRMFCAGEYKGGNETCRGDVGGPLIQSQLSKEGYLYWTQVGIHTWGNLCDLSNTLGFYSHVSNLRSWIDQQITKTLAKE